jgi:large conductance mechanosensitive channel
MLKDFKAFILRGNVIDLAIGIVIGAAFGAVVASLVKDIIMPPIGLALSGIDFSSLMAVIKQGTPPGPYTDPAAAIAAKAVTINYGTFLLTVISFLVIAAVIFFFVVRPMVSLTTRKPTPAPAAAPTTKDCPFCYTAIPIKATRCPNCTSELAK